MAECVVLPESHRVLDGCSSRVKQAEDSFGGLTGARHELGKTIGQVVSTPIDARQPVPIAALGLVNGTMRQTRWKSYQHAMVSELLQAAIKCVRDELPDPHNRLLRSVAL